MKNTDVIINIFIIHPCVKLNWGPPSLKSSRDCNICQCAVRRLMPAEIQGLRKDQSTISQCDKRSFVFVFSPYSPGVVWDKTQSFEIAFEQNLNRIYNILEGAGHTCWLRFRALRWVGPSFPSTKNLSPPIIRPLPNIVIQINITTTRPWTTTIVTATLASTIFSIYLCTLNFKALLTWDL